jgi:hypothetical protein
VRRVLALTRPAPEIGDFGVSVARRLSYIALLIAAPLLPQFGNSYRTFPAVSNFWVYLPFCALFLAPLLDVRKLRRMLHLDLLALLSLGISLDAWHKSTFLALLFTYAPLAYLCVRMVSVARVGQSGRKSSQLPAARIWLPRSWLLAGIVVLLAVHVSWNLGGSESTDVGPASVEGALKLAHGQPVYGISHATLANYGYDPHRDTYGPVVYESYLPFASITGSIAAARLTALFFDLLTAALLFALGRQVRGPTAGVVLAYAWLAFPITLYTGGVAANDSLVAAALVGTLLVARSPAKRGAMSALAAWTKLSPLALLPVMLSYAPSARPPRRALLAFGGAFALASALVLLPVLLHSSVSTFATRTFGYQFSRPPGFSIWEYLDFGGYAGAAWIKPVSQVAHGLLLALAGAFVAALLWVPKRQDVVGLAGASAAVLLALQFLDGYFSLTYILWFVPLVLVALVLDGSQRGTGASSVAARGEQHSAREDQSTTVSAFGRLVSSS